MKDARAGDGFSCIRSESLPLSKRSSAVPIGVQARQTCLTKARTAQTKRIKRQHRQIATDREDGAEHRVTASAPALSDALRQLAARQAAGRNQLWCGHSVVFSVL
jgi:hypothetical protein